MVKIVGSLLILYIWHLSSEGSHFTHTCMTSSFHSEWDGVHKTSLTPTTFYWNAYGKLQKWAFIYMCERSINFAYIPMIFFLVEFGTGLTVWYLFVFHFTAKCDSIILYYSAHRFSFYFVLLCVCTFWVACCDVRYDFRIKTMFGSSLPPVVCRRAHVLFTLFVFVYV